MNNLKDFRINILEDFRVKMIWQGTVCYNSSALVFSNTSYPPYNGDEIFWTAAFPGQHPMIREHARGTASFSSSSLGGVCGVQRFPPLTQSAYLGERTFPPGLLKWLWAHQLPGIPPLSPTDPVGYQDNQELRALTASMKPLVCP